MWKLLRAALAAWNRPPGTAGPPDGSPSAATDPGEARPPTQAAPNLPVDAGAGSASLKEQIRVRAYLLAESAGFPEGQDDEFWLRAEREVRGEEGQPPQATGSR